MKTTKGEINGIILTEEEAECVHLWLSDYLETLIGYDDFETTEKHRLALEVRKKMVRELIDNLLKELSSKRIFEYNDPQFLEGRQPEIK